MNDLISKQNLIMTLTVTAEETKQMKVGDLKKVVNVINNQPSAQPEIIRCKDCKHYQFADNRAFGMPVKMCEWFGFEDVDDDDFCSRGERKTDETD